MKKIIRILAATFAGAIVSCMIVGLFGFWLSIDISFKFMSNTFITTMLLWGIEVIKNC